jgi:putative sterol carrier protein
MAEPLAGLVRRASGRQLDLLMRTPARRAVLETVFWQMPGRLDRARAVGINATVRWRLTGGRSVEPDVYDLVIADGRARALRGERVPAPTLTVTVDAAEFLRIAIGASNPVNAYFAGKMTIRGNLMQASRLTTIFRVPTAGPATQPAPDGTRP